jgi:phosphoribosylformylglycinamidine synthase
MKAKIHITLKNGVLDPQGRAIVGALHNMGYAEVEDVRQGKYIEVDLKVADVKTAKETLEKICSSLLANTVMENYSYELEGIAG